MVVKTGSSQGLSRSAVVFTSLGLALSAVYAAACSSAGSSNPPGTGSSSTGASSSTGGMGSNTGGAANIPGSGAGSPGGGSTTGDPNMEAACVPEGQTALSLPASFNGRCSGCHSANGESAFPAVPNLFKKLGTLDEFKTQVRTGKAPMPAFDAAAMSDAEVEQTFNYFKAGVPGNVAVCTDANGTNKGNDLCGNGVSFAPLFTTTADTLEPIAKKDANGHIIFRGAGRVRFRHEMEPEFATYHGHYFENRTFGYIIDDAVAAGGDSLTITFLPNSNQYYSAQGVNQEGGADLNIRFWKLYGHPDGNAYAGNVGGASKDVNPFDCTNPMTSCNTQKYVYTVKNNQRENRKIMKGDQFQVEFGIFMARYSVDDTKGPPVDGGHVRNNWPLPEGCTLNGPPYNNKCYTQANYYSDSFRYVVGEGYITPYNEDCTMSVPPDSGISGSGDCGPDGTIAQAVKAGKIKERMGPGPAGWSGGLATLPYMRQRFDMYYSQMSPNVLLENAENFMDGRRLFHLDYTKGEHIEVDNKVTAEEMKPYVGIAGPLHNQVACEGCHVHNNRGFAPAEKSAFSSVVLKLSGKDKDPHGAPVPDPNYGLQLQDKSTGGVKAEGSGSFTYESVAGKFGDGTAYTLRKPKVVFTGLAAGDPQAYSVRLARPMIGIGLLEAIPEGDIIAKSDPSDCNQDGISGVANIVWSPEDSKMHVGRFGWKASKVSARHQAAEAAMLDMGVTTSLFPQLDCGTMQAGCTDGNTATPELSDTDLGKLVTYLRSLAVPPRRDINDPQVLKGQDLFAASGCVSCHAPNQHTGNEHPFLELRDQVIHPYSDLLLHDMGPDLTDNSVSEYKAGPTEWRTPPLWGIGLCDDVAAGWQKDGDQNNPAPNLGPCNYLHDGRAEHLLDAVLWHGGEAQGAKDKVLAMSAGDRDALVAFLKSL
jgi:CxxC motif-containing protein (DUF1111 family)/mono/diheme cytochrome c family protein